MRMSGSPSHGETDPLAGQRKAARGNEGARYKVSDLVSWVPLSSPFLSLRRGLCWPLAVVPISCCVEVSSGVGNHSVPIDSVLLL